MYTSGVIIVILHSDLQKFLPFKYTAYYPVGYRSPQGDSGNAAFRLPLICFRKKRRHVKREIAAVSVSPGIALRFYVFSPADYRL